jgi:hypothetical protein
LIGPVIVFVFGGVTDSGRDLMAAALLSAGQQVYEAVLLSCAASEPVDKLLQTRRARRGGDISFCLDIPVLPAFPGAPSAPQLVRGGQLSQTARFWLPSRMSVSSRLPVSGTKPFRKPKELALHFK